MRVLIRKPSLRYILFCRKDYSVYELNRVELLCDTCERSCQQYVAVRQQMVPPDPVRLRYRHQLTALIATIVRSDARAEPAVIRALLPDTVAAEDRERFIELVGEEFRSLHPGNAIRFGLRPLEFAAWRERNPSADRR